VNLDRFTELARREEEAVEGRNWEELIAIQKEQLELLASLPDALPREALTGLEQALDRCRNTQQLLFSSLAETQGILERIRAGGRALGAYTSNRRSRVDARA
jgi:hypothetical protein